MFGGGMYSSMQRAKAEAADTDELATKMEASRKARAEEAARGRAKLKLEREKREQRAQREAAELAAQRAGAGTAQKRKPDSGADAATAAEFAKLSASRDVRTAKSWYYMDASGAKQGPFESTQMRQWFAAGHLPRDLRVCATFEHGVVPPESEMRAIAEIFRPPLERSAFRSLTPPAPSVLPEARAKPDDEPAGKRARAMPEATGNWLVDSQNRQKAGFHRLRHDRNEGPGMLFESHDG